MLNDTILKELINEYQDKMKPLQKSGDSTAMSACDLEFNQRFHTLISEFIEEHTPVETDGQDHSLDILNILTTISLMDKWLSAAQIGYITQPILGDLKTVRFIQSIVQSKCPSLSNTVLHQTIARHEELAKKLDALSGELQTPFFDSNVDGDIADVKYEQVNQLLLRVACLVEFMSGRSKMKNA